MANNAYEYEFYNKDAAERFRELSREGAVSLFIYSKNVFAGGEIRCTLDGGSRCVALDGIAYAVPAFFETFGATVTAEGGNATLTLNGRSVTLPTTRTDGAEMVPIIETARALGLAAAGFYEDRLTVVGAQRHIEAMAADVEMQNAAAYLTLGEYDPYSLRPEDYKAARAKWRLKLVGSPELNDMTNDAIREKIESISDNGQKAWDNMNKSADRVALFGDHVPVESVELERQYVPLARMAKAWGTYGSRLYHNEELLRDVKEAVQWMYENMYGEAEIEGRGWRDAHLFNWYYWYISAPEALTDIFFIMEDEFTLEEKRAYLKCFDWCSTFMRHWFRRDAALSRICVCTKVGIACEYPNRLFEEYVDFDMLLGLGTTEEGPRIDYAQWTHGMAYNNSYGKLNLDRVLHVASSIAGTPVEYKSPKQYNLFNFIKYMYEPVSYKGQAFYMFMGRRVDGKETWYGGNILADALPMYGMFGEGEDKYLAEYIKRNASLPEIIYSVKANANIASASLFERIMSDDSVQVKEYEYAHSYYTADRAVQQRSNYAFGVHLSSEREKSWESINSENKTGWHVGDGSTYIYTDYDRHAFDGDNFIHKNIEIAYRVPGTTEDVRERTIRSITSSKEWKSPNSFAGSMHIDNKYIVASMDFVSYNFEGPDTHPDDGDSGGSLPIHLNDLKAKKSYFLFDKEMVCLGAGINSTMDSPVYTTAEHRRIVNADADVQTLSGEVLPKECFERTVSLPATFNMAGHAGYAFFGEGELRVHRYVHENSGGQSFIEANVCHGKNPVDGKYAYAVLPYATEEQTAAYLKAPEFDILSNNRRLQCVRKPSLGITAYVFHEACADHGVYVSAPAIVTVTNRKISIVEPTHKLDRLVVKVWGERRILNMPDEVEVDIAAGYTTFTVDTRCAYGRSFDIDIIPDDTGLHYMTECDKSHVEAFGRMSEEGAVAAFIYCRKAFVRGESVYLDEDDRTVRTVAKGGVVMVPKLFFERFLGVKLPEEIEKGAVTMEGGEYLPAVDTARALGVAADVFYEGRLAVFGTEEQIAAIKADDLLAEAGAYAVFGEYDAKVFTSDDYRAAKDQWRLRLVGSPEMNDISDDAIKSKISYRDSLCEKALALINRAPDKVAFFGEVGPTESDDLWVQYKHLEAMALAWGTFGCRYYHSDEVLKEILAAMKWLYENLYGEAEIAGTGWRDIHAFNWWHWYFGAPDCLTNAMLVVEDHLTKEDKENYLKCYKYIRSVMWSGDRTRAGADSRITPGAKAAILLEDARYLEKLQEDCDTMIGVYENGGRVHRADYVNWTHYCPHNISYGVIKLQRGLFATSIFASTALDISSPKGYNLFNLIRYCYEPAMYRAQGFVMFSGRSTFAVERSQGCAIIAAALPMIGTFGKDEDEYLKGFIKRHTANDPEIIRGVKSSASIYDCALLNSILKDESISTENGYEYAHAWFTGDRAAQHRNNYAIGIAMSSRREKAYECINSANKTGWYTGDGATYIYTDYDGHQYDGDNFITKNEAIAYRFPGTTEDSRPRVARSIANEWEWYPENTVAGSMQIDKKYIAACMDYISFNSTEDDVHPDDYGHGGSQAVHHNDLRARKAWFCFDGETVCLGAGISSTMDSPVHTTLEHRRIVNPAEDVQCLNGEKLPKEDYERRARGKSFVNMKGHAGFVTLEDSELCVRRYVCEAANSQTFFEVGIDHGKNPENASYAYAIIPYTDCKSLAAYRDEP
ncbi:MAG: hypothetical protein J6Q69_01020, partial [Clostridia bacterium]|nr:hypothetical protein [Clostridia bacterium]